MENYKIGEKLGEGSFGVVYKATKNGKPFAIKQISSVNAFKKDEVEQQSSIMKKLTHPNLVKVHESYYDQQNQISYIVMDYCDQGDLLKYYKTKNKHLLNSQILSIMKQIVDAFITMNEKGVIHRDLKPQNILVCKGGNIKIADFGCARNIRSEDISKIIKMSIDKGTPCFAASQLLDSQPYSNKCDVWSAGCIIYFLAIGKLPFWSKSIAQIKQLVKQMTQNKEIQIPIPQTGEVSDQVKYIIKRSLMFKDIQRSSWREFYLSRALSEKLTSVKQYLDYLKCISNIANWISKTFWKERKKYKITQCKDQILIYFIIKFQFSVLRLGQKIIERDPAYKYLFKEQAWKKQDLDQYYCDQFKNVYLKQTQDYFNLLKNSIKSSAALKVIQEKTVDCFLVFSDLQNSIRAAYKILIELQGQIKSDDEKVMAVIAHWVNFQRWFDVQNKPNLEKILSDKIQNVKQEVMKELLKSISAR